MTTNKFRNFLIIGVGQLGSRHLQALGKVDCTSNIYVLDTSINSRTTALDRFNESNPEYAGNLCFLNNLTELPAKIDLAIIATTSNIRLSIIEDLLKSTTVSNLILEKVLFQDLNHYPHAEMLFRAHNVRAWVNCPQRLWPFFQEIRARFGNSANLEILVQGSNWGLGCNAVHNADIATFIWTGSLNHYARLDPFVHESKRAGFKEFTGELMTRAECGGMVRQVSYSNGNAPFRISVTHPMAHLHWDVLSGTLIEANEKSNWEWIRREIRTPYQSELTAQIVENILIGRDCGLPDYKSAAHIHTGVLKAILDGMRRNHIDFGNVCPIT